MAYTHWLEINPQNIPENQTDESGGLDIPFDSCSNASSLTIGQKIYLKNQVKKALVVAGKTNINVLNYSSFSKGFTADFAEENYNEYLAVSLTQNLIKISIFTEQKLNSLGDDWQTQYEADSNSDTTEDEIEENPGDNSEELNPTKVAGAPSTKIQNFLAFLRKHKFKIIFTFLAAPVGFLVLGGLSAGFIFASPAIVALLAGNIGLTIGIIAASATVGAILFPILNLTVASMLKSIKNTLSWISRTVILAGILGGLTAGFIFYTASGLAAVIVPVLGLPMTIIALIGAALVVSAAAHFLEQLLAVMITPDPKYKTLTTIATTLKFGFRTLLYAGLMGGLVAGIIFGAAPALGAALVVSAGSLALIIADMVAFSLMASVLMIFVYASIGIALGDKSVDTSSLPTEKNDDPNRGTYKKLIDSDLGKKDAELAIKEKHEVSETTSNGKGNAFFNCWRKIPVLGNCFQCDENESSSKALK